MKALTVQQPWCGLIAAGLKNVENRTWRRELAEPFAIHAGKTIDDIAVRFDNTVRRAMKSLQPDFQYPVGAVVAVARLYAPPHMGRDGCCVPWGQPGQWHWPLFAVRRLPEPVPCKGALGLWTLPADVAAQAERQLAEQVAR